MFDRVADWGEELLEGRGLGEEGLTGELLGGQDMCGDQVCEYLFTISCCGFVTDGEGLGEIGFCIGVVFFEKFDDAAVVGVCATSGFGEVF